VSASDAQVRSEMQRQLQDALSSMAQGNEAGVVSVASDAAVEQPVSAAAGFSGFQTSLNPDSTNLERGLELAGSLVPDGYRGRVVLLSDGGETQGDAALAARLLRSRGVRVDVVPERASSGPDVLVQSVSAPSSLASGERSTVTVRIQSNFRTAAQVSVYRDRTLVGSRQVQVRAGTQTLDFPQPALKPGFHGYSVQVSAPGDRQPENDRGSAFTVVGGRPTVLVISSNAGEATNVVDALQSTGIRAVLRPPDQIVPDLSQLERFASVVVVDTPAELLGQKLMALLVPYVRDLGHGLVVVGGQQAYGLGGYGHTPLEQALPVKMDLPKRPDLPSVGVVIIVESLEANLPINISKEAAKGVIQLLTEEDRVAVNDVPDNGSSGWTVRLRPATDKGAIGSAIDGMTPGDPESYAAALRSAYQVLISSPTRLRHIILLGDGDANDPRYKALATDIHRHGITISTVVTNAVVQSDKDTMRTIAKAGGGRYYEANETKSIPRIFLHEARTVARSGIVTGRFTPRPVSSNPMLRDLVSIPPLDGYVATTLKRRSEMVLASNKMDPVLASWQFGLGRAVAWTSDAAGLWSSDFVRGPRANRFWSDVVGWTLPASDANRLYVSTTRSGGQARISVDLPSTLGTSPRVQARVSGPAGGTTIELQPSTPGRYAGSFQATGQGAYFVTVEARGDGHAALGEGGIVVAYPDEYRTGGTNRLLLQTTAQDGGGSVLAQPKLAWGDPLPTVFQQEPLTWLLWLIALLLLPLDIAARRLVLTRRDLETLRDALTRRRDPPEAA
jgi:uncharacterized membrane protein/NAD(P)H-hydrate repair Nnr-like enzyme with NAD(P)H-hydrate epimerase domain